MRGSWRHTPSCGPSCGGIGELGSGGVRGLMKRWQTGLPRQLGEEHACTLRGTFSRDLHCARAHVLLYGLEGVAKARARAELVLADAHVRLEYQAIEWSPELRRARHGFEARRAVARGWGTSMASCAVQDVSVHWRGSIGAWAAERGELAGAPGAA